MLYRFDFKDEVLVDRKDAVMSINDIDAILLSHVTYAHFTYSNTMFMNGGLDGKKNARQIQGGHKNTLS